MYRLIIKLAAPDCDTSIPIVEGWGSLGHHLGIHSFLVRVQLNSGG